MYYRMLGNTGLQTSVLSYGFWATFGVKDGLQNREGIEVAKRCLTTMCFKLNDKQIRQVAD